MGVHDRQLFEDRLQQDVTQAQIHYFTKGISFVGEATPENSSY
jgi:hypothetical protein